MALTLSDGSRLETDLLMAATGRRPNTDDLGLEAAGVAVNAKGAIEVDAFSQTSQANIYAVGDVTDRIALTPVAIAEAMAFVDTVYRDSPRAMDHSNVASAVFSHPPVSTVGLSEPEARETYGDLDLYRSSFRPMKHTLSGRDEKTMMKMIVAARQPKGGGGPRGGPRRAGDRPRHRRCHQGPAPPRPTSTPPSASTPQRPKNW